MPYLHPTSLSPDPLYDWRGRPVNAHGTALAVFPYAVVRQQPRNALPQRWVGALDLHHDPGPVKVQADAQGRADLVLDFGTELEGELELVVETPGPVTLFLGFGESVPEAEGVGLPSICHAQLPAKELWKVASGRQRMRYASRGFRFVRLNCFDLERNLLLKRAVVHCRFTFRGRPGDFWCSDARFQRVWQSSVYTARLCARPDTIWDGIKRDRHGWYGDARIAKATLDSVFLDPGPTEAMMLKLPVDSWANAIPNFSFDCVAMLKAHILTFGRARPCIQPVYDRIRRMLSWAGRTQTDPQGRLVRGEGVEYQFGIGFVDWSPLPRGGRFEELCWLQCAYAEALSNAAWIAGWLGRGREQQVYSAHARQLVQLVRRRFFDPQRGFHHTLNQSERGPWRMQLEPDVHYQQSYGRKIRLGPSGPSRQANARAVFAGACAEAIKPVLLARVFNNDRIARIVTPYYAYYEQAARAACGDPAGAILNMRQYIGDMLERHDAATVWESYEPMVRGIGAYGLHTWPKSLCHGWSSGAVPLAGQYLLGLLPTAPGFGRITLQAAAPLPWTFRATLPTPHGPIEVEKPTRHGPIRYRIPRPIEVSGAETVRAIIERRR